MHALAVWLRLHRNSVRPIQARPTTWFRTLQEHAVDCYNPSDFPSCMLCPFSFTSLSHSQASRPAICSRTIDPWLSFLLQLSAWRIAPLVAAHFFPSHASPFQKPQVQSQIRLHLPLRWQFHLCQNLANQNLPPRQAKNGKGKRTRSESCMKPKICH